MPEVAVRESPIGGLGVFALDPLRAGEVVRERKLERRITPRSPLRPEQRERPEHCTLVDGCLFLVASPDRYFNHSCDPNVYLRFARDRVDVVARRGITAGCELSRKMGGPQLFGLTAPLLLDSSGQKMGKTSTGERVWLDAERTPPYSFYQYFLNVTDEDAARLLKIFSLRPLAEIDELVRSHDADRSQRLAQRELARELTTWVHGAEETARVEEASRIMFGGSLEGVEERTLELLTKVVPVVEIDRTELEKGIALIELLTRTVAESKTAARRLVGQCAQAGQEHVAHFLERDGTDVAERCQLAEHAQHARRLP